MYRPLTLHTWARAREIVKKNHIKACYDCKKDYFHFVVKQRCGKLADVFYFFDIKTEDWVYNCTSLSDKLNRLGKRKTWTCSNMGFTKEPQCSHALALKLKLKQIRKQRY